jgi:hypothetical protein
MRILLGAIALVIAMPVAAQAAPAPAPKADCCEQMKAKGEECCCKHMDHSKHDPKTGAQSGSADPSAPPAHSHEH